jgi:hypothetical protein
VCDHFWTANKRHSAAIVAECRGKNYAAAPVMAIQSDRRGFDIDDSEDYYGFLPDLRWACGREDLYERCIRSLWKQKGL